MTAPRMKEAVALDLLRSGDEQMEVLREVAVVVLIVIVNLLRQHDAGQGQRAALGLVLGNLIGGLAAALVYDLVLLSNTLAFFVAICLAASLMFASRIVTSGDRAPVYVIAFATFILLLGHGLTPLPDGSGAAFVSRLLNVLLTSAYTMGAVARVERRRIRLLPDMPVRPRLS